MREEWVARGEVVPELEPLECRLELQEHVLSAVRALPEPQRTAIFLRYFEDLAPAEIASRMGLPLPTVKTRLARGKQLLRERLDREQGGDRRAWLAPLLPGALTSKRWTWMALGGTMSTKTKVVAVLGAVALASIWIWPEVSPGGGQAESIPSRVGLLGVASLQGETEPLAQVESSPADRTGVAPASAELEAAPGAAAKPPAEIVPTEIRGLVIDVDSWPIAGVRVLMKTQSRAVGEVQPTGLEAISGADGRFRFEQLSERGGVFVSDPHWVGVAWSLADPGREAVLVVAPPIERRGRVVDTDGLPIEDALVNIFLPEDFRRRFSVAMDGTIDSVNTVHTDDQGQFLFEQAAQVEGMRISIAAEGYVSAHFELPFHPQDDLWVQLERLQEEPLDAVRGTVVDATDEPVADALVSFGSQAGRTGEDGRFELALTEETLRDDRLSRWGNGEVRVLRAVAEGFLPASIELGKTTHLGMRAWPREVTLRLGEAALSLEGQVVNERGGPLDGMLCYLGNVTWFSGENNGQTLESVIFGKPGTRWIWTKSDEAGRFQLDGLLDRPYSVVVTDPTTLVQVHVEGVHPRDGLARVVLDTSAVWETVKGRVLDRRGQPVAGAQIHRCCDSSDIYHQDQYVRTSTVRGREVAITDELGQFVLPSVPKRWVYLRVEGSDVEGQSFFHREGERIGDQQASVIENLDLEVDLRTRIQVVLQNPDRADWLAVLNAAGEPLRLYRYRGKRGKGEHGLAILDGRSEVVSVATEAAQLVLYSQGELVEELPLELVVGEVNLVQP